jgi:hypothetical protein
VECHDDADDDIIVAALMAVQRSDDLSNSGQFAHGSYETPVHKGILVLAGKQLMVIYACARCFTWCALLAE